jgi:glucan endo-1,3-alpha-glucosidase
MSYTVATWEDDVNQAAAAGFDGFALNHGSDSWQFDRMSDAYNVAAKKSFKMFL